MPERPKNPGVEQENARPDDPPSGRPPRPATEPPGAKASTRSPKLTTDPGSGEDRNRAAPKTKAPPDWP